MAFCIFRSSIRPLSNPSVDLHDDLPICALGAGVSGRNPRNKGGPSGLWAGGRVRASRLGRMMGQETQT